MKTMPASRHLRANDGPLGEEAVARVDRVDVVALGQLDDLVLGQIGRHRLQPLADQVGLVGLVAVEVDAVLLGEDRDGAEAQLGAGAKDPNRDLASVGARGRGGRGRWPS